MSQFYVTDEQSARVAREASLHRTAVSMTGTAGNGIRSFTGWFSQSRRIKRRRRNGGE
jgi:hypothetical protein